MQSFQSKETKSDERPLRLLFLLSRFLDGGIDTVLLEYVNHLADHLHYDVTLGIAICYGDLEVYRQKLSQRVKVIYFNQSPFLTRLSRQRIEKKASFFAASIDEILFVPLRRLATQRGIYKLSRQADAIIDFDCRAYAFLHHIRKRKIAFFHFSFDQVLKNNPKRMNRMKKGLAAYHKVVTISRAMCEEGRKMFPQFKEKFILLYNAKDEQLLAEYAEKTIDNPLIQQPYLLAVERLEESQKDLSTLIRAYSLLVHEHHISEWLYIIGKGKDEAQLKQLAKTLQVADKVVFLGFQPTPLPWILHCKIFVHSAKFEGLPTVLIEALLLDKLIVATDCPTGPREILDHGRCGLLTPVGDAPAFAAAVLQLLNDKSLQQRLLSAAEEQKKIFTFAHIDRQLHALFLGETMY